MTRIWCFLRSAHEWKEGKILRWCTKCAYTEVNDPTEGWIYFDPDKYDDSWMQPADEKTIADELLEFLNYWDARGVT